MIDWNKHRKCLYENPRLVGRLQQRLDSLASDAQFCKYGAHYCQSFANGILQASIRVGVESVAKIGTTLMLRPDKVVVKDDRGRNTTSVALVDDCGDCMYLLMMTAPSEAQLSSQGPHGLLKQHLDTMRECGVPVMVMNNKYYMFMIDGVDQPVKPLSLDLFTEAAVIFQLSPGQRFPPNVFHHRDYPMVPFSSPMPILTLSEEDWIRESAEIMANYGK